MLFEAKFADTDIARTTRNLATRVGVPVVQVVHRPGIYREEPDALIVSADRLLAALP